MISINDILNYLFEININTLIIIIIYTFLSCHMIVTREAHSRQKFFLTCGSTFVLKMLAVCIATLELTIYRRLTVTAWQK